jgi:hypothetical protein
MTRHSRVAGHNIQKLQPVQQQPLQGHGIFPTSNLPLAYQLVGRATLVLRKSHYTLVRRQIRPIRIGQHTFQAEDYNAQMGTSNNQRYWEALPENTASQIPHLVATFRPDTDSTTLEFCSSNADKYKIFEDHGAGSSTTYRGPGCSILVHRQLGGTNHYAVSARLNGVWTPVSQWLIVQY